MNRRTLLKASAMSGATLSFLGLGGLAKAFEPAPHTTLKPQAILSDSRFPASRSFGLQAARMGLPHFVNSGDITAIWSRHLDPLWREGQAMVMGLTSAEQLFCLERLAWDRDMRVVLRAQHVAEHNGSISHRIEAPVALADNVAHLTASIASWPSSLAALLGTCTAPQLSGACTRRRASSAGSLDAPLVTWVIAPRPARPV